MSAALKEIVFSADGGMQIDFGSQTIQIPGESKSVLEKNGEQRIHDDIGFGCGGGEAHIALLGLRRLNRLSCAGRLRQRLREVFPKGLLQRAGFVIAGLLVGLHLAKPIRRSLDDKARAA